MSLKDEEQDREVSTNANQNEKEVGSLRGGVTSAERVPILNENADTVPGTDSTRNTVTESSNLVKSQEDREKVESRYENAESGVISSVTEGGGIALAEEPQEAGTDVGCNKVNTEREGKTNPAITAPNTFEDGTPITAAHKTRFEELHSLAHRRFKDFILFFSVIYEIYVERLYRVKYVTFEDYARTEFGYTRQWVYNAIDVAKILRVAPEILNCGIKNVSQILALKGVEPNDMPKVIETAKKKSTKGITAKNLKQARKMIQGTENTAAGASVKSTKVRKGAVGKLGNVKGDNVTEDAISQKTQPTLSGIIGLMNELDRLLNDFYQNGALTEELNEIRERVLVIMDGIVKALKASKDSK